MFKGLFTRVAKKIKDKFTRKPREYLFLKETKENLPDLPEGVFHKRGRVHTIVSHYGIVSFVIREGKPLVRKIFKDTAGGKQINTKKEYYALKIANLLIPGHVINPRFARLSRKQVEAIKGKLSESEAKKLAEKPVLYSDPIPVPQKYLQMIAEIYEDSVPWGQAYGLQEVNQRKAQKLSQSFRELGINVNTHEHNYTINTETGKIVFFEIINIDEEKLANTILQVQDLETRRKLENYFKRFKALKWS